MKPIQITLIIISLSFINEIELETCSDYFEDLLKTSCENLSSGDSYGCQYLYGRCFTKKSVCLSPEATNEEKCKKLIPYNLLYKCSFINGQCQEVLKECSEHQEGKTDCMSLSAGDPSKICSLKNGNCVPVNRTCFEFTSGVDNSSFCYSLNTSDKYKLCIYSPEKKGCIERYKECYYYNKNTFEDDRNKEECESIEYYDYYDNRFDFDYKCVFDPDDNSCFRKKKECSDIKDKDLCFSYNLNKIRRRCVYIYNRCEEEIESCYDADYRECSSVTIFKDDNTVDTSKVCAEEDYECYIKDVKSYKEISKCSDNWSESSCLHSEVSYRKRCFINDKGDCIEKYISCPTYSSKEECNSIKLAQDNEICVYDEKKGDCIQLKKSCSEYKGTNEYICYNDYGSLDKDKKCFMENGQCREKYIYCENYTDTIAAYCRSIIPHDTKGNSLDTKYKCVMGENNRCERKRKECQDFNTIEECQFFEISLTKNCAFKNGQCTEQYKTCYDYVSSGEPIEESKCNSIILEDETSKCVFDSGSCIKEKKICSDFNIENYITKCGEMSKKFPYKKCEYSDSVCKDVNRTCLEITTSTTDEICEYAKPSEPTTKKCVAKIDYRGCEEINRVIRSNEDFSEYLGFVYNFLLIIFMLFL